MEMNISKSGTQAHSVPLKNILPKEKDADKYIEMPANKNLPLQLNRLRGNATKQEFVPFDTFIKENKNAK